MAETQLPTQIQLEVVTPDRQVVHEKVDSVFVPGKRGYLGVMPGHAPLLSELAPGAVTYIVAGSKRRIAVSWGFAEVLPDRVIVLAQTAEPAEEIDLSRAESALSRAEGRLKNASDPSIDRERAQIAYEKALARLHCARQKEI